MLIGSCFTENIGNILIESKFKCDMNPFGILYNPISIKNGLEILLTNKVFGEEDIEFYNEKWFSYYHHSRFSDKKKLNCLDKINSRIYISRNFLKQTDYLFITFGTSWVYQLKENGIIVSNCHKKPTNLFKRYLLDLDFLCEEYKSLIEKLKKYNPNINVVFTISPIRHWKDGATENLVSKSILAVLVNKIKTMFSNIDYFPSYEIMMDDLRDYRFYDEDMLHVNKTAINYIWDKFVNTYIREYTLNTMREINKIIQAVNHRQEDITIQGYQTLVEKTLQKIEKLKIEHKNVDFSEEETFLKGRLIG